MPLAAMAIPALISAGGSIAGSLLGKKSSNTTTNTPIYTPGQTSMQGTVADTLNTRLKKGGAGYFAPAKTAAISQNNDAFTGLQDSMQRSLVGRGFGSSGKVGLNTERIGIARAGQIGGIDANYDEKAAGYDQNTLQQALQFAFAGAGQKSVGPSPGAFGGAVNGGIGTLTTLLTLNHMLGAGGGDSGGGGEPIGTLDTAMAG
jgi:hypothetical protein